MDALKQNKTGNVVLPDWLGSGQDLFGTIQIIKGKTIKQGFLEFDFDFRFSETFNYPIIFEIRNVEAEIEAYAIGFRFDEEIDVATRAIEERVIAPKVCSTLCRPDFVTFLADVVEKDIDFALYLNKTPKKFKNIKTFALSSDQRIILNERLIMEVMDVLDKRNA